MEQVAVEHVVVHAAYEAHCSPARVESVGLVAGVAARKIPLVLIVARCTLLGRFLIAVSVALGSLSGEYRYVVEVVFPVESQEVVDLPLVGVVLALEH